MLLAGCFVRKLDFMDFFLLNRLKEIGRFIRAGIVFVFVYFIVLGVMKEDYKLFFFLRKMVVEGGGLFSKLFLRLFWVFWYIWVLS